MPPIRRRDFVMPLGAFTMAIVLGFYARYSINDARDNAASERGKNYERVLHERRALGMDRDVLEDRLRRKAERGDDGGVLGTPKAPVTRNKTQDGKGT